MARTGEDAPGGRWRGSGLGGWLLRRVLSGVVVLLVVSLLVFLATQVLPSDPAQAILGRRATPEQLVRLRHQLGLDRPLWEQYWHWLRGVLTGDLGQSLAAGRPVSSVVADRLRDSLALMTYAAAVAIPLPIVIGTWLAVRRDRFTDRVTSPVVLTLLALPDFVIATGVVLFFATSVFTVLPASTILPPGASAFTQVRQLVLPALALTLISAPYTIRLSRAAMIEELDSEYVAMARLRGISERNVVWRHALPNALVPAIQSSALTLSYLLGGIVIVEVIFNYPGLGTLFQNAESTRDLPVIQAVCMVFAAGIVVANIAADVLTVLLTPRLRTSGGMR
ncbi:ABC transporter permease [Streptomyces sp. NPDC057253]|uniref:ABC transporter permease n=1 Tax=Streptomyces sp. NPDC057253 TaxID=3346069 RepID=UPI003630A229